MRHPDVRKRDALPALFHKLGYTMGAEIGVMKGNFSKLLLESVPNLELYCVDIWDMYPGYDVRVSRNHQEDFYMYTKTLLKEYHVEFVKEFSMDAVKEFSNEVLDFVYIDANHDFDYVMEDIIEWSKKVRKGGIVSGHDYFPFPAGDGGVVQAVDAYVNAHMIRQLYLTDDRERTWFFFKE